MKNITKYLLLAIFPLIIFLYIFYDVCYIAPKSYVIRNEILSSDLIDPQIEDLKIAFFTDLEYGKNMDNFRLEKIVSTINSTNCDVVLFGGDLIGEGIYLNNIQKENLIENLSNIQAPLGKFAVLGDNDQINQSVQKEIEEIFAPANFEVLHNSYKAIRNKKSASISLIGLDNEINGDINHLNAFENVPNNNYSLVLCHTPDTITNIDENKVDYFICGHTHGGQFNLLFYSYYSPEAATTFTKGKHQFNESFIVDISNGVGTAKKDIRFLAKQEIVVYTFKHIEKEESLTIEDIKND